ncbi:Protein lsr2 [Nostocoides japonicum T1-X7]|uniref:Protein lsr2 n=1 Tax=Nostocoides japonicum T1-X7 TaxID=1194083 RepID=A0A077M8P0_9MICO|nr:Lsr2 family protein [Tetrasphaera japonica]CCH80409.1 Protein lsr2 [Tetrasphaera japonica T1-X7]
MAKRVQVTLVDDTDGTNADETVSFSLDGVSYEIDLSSQNAEKLRNSFAPWIGFATRSGGRRTASRPAATSSGSRKDLSGVRDWARKHGFQVSDRGRISADVQAAYDKAHH